MLSNIGKRKSTSFPKSIRLNSRQISVIMATAHVKPVVRHNNVEWGNESEAV
jgi:hypothetical protein